MPSKAVQREIVINGRYRVLRSLGEGAMGAVHLVSDTLDEDRLIAFKTVRAEVITPDLHRLLKYEFAALTQLRHPNVVEVYDFGVIQGTSDFFFTMEFVEGRNLLDACKNASLNMLVGYAAQICRALEYIHSQGFTHFDLKPDNIMVNLSGLVKVMDFGLVEQGSFFEARVLKGTVAYIAPEMIRGLKVDHRIDLYSLGAVLFHVVTGRFLFPENTVDQVLRAHLNQKPNFVDGVGRPVPKEFRLIVERLLAKQPADRYASATEVLADIERLLAHVAHQSLPESNKAYSLSSRLVGRQHELGRLKERFHQRLAAPSQKTPSLILVAGQSGMGKSRLMKEFCHYVQLSGVTFLHGYCLQNGGQSLQPFAEMLRTLVREILALTNTSPVLVSDHDDKKSTNATTHLKSLVKEDAPADSYSLVTFAKTLGPANKISAPTLMTPMHRFNDPEAPTVVESESPSFDSSARLRQSWLPDHLEAASVPSENACQDWIELLHTFASAISRLVPDETALCEMQGDVSSKAQEGSEKDWLIASISKFLIDLSRSHPLVLYCSDLHWADELTIELLVRLAQDVSGAVDQSSPPGLLICGCFRHDEIGDGFLDNAIQDMSQKGTLDLVTLKPLNANHVHEMLQSMLGHADLSQTALATLAERTGGNPFSLETAIQDALENAILVRSQGHWKLAERVLGHDLAPATVTEALDRVLSKLDDGDASVLRLLSVFNRPVSIQLLYAAGYSSADDHSLELSKTLYRLRKRNLVERGWIKGKYQFSLRHAQLRDHVYQGLSSDMRRTLHESVASAIELIHPNNERYLDDLAAHFIRAHNVDKAMTYARKAADQAKRVYDLKRAAALYTQAYEISLTQPDTLPIQIKQADLALAIAEVSYYTPSTQTCERLQKALSLSEKLGDTRRITQLQNWLGRNYYALGKHPEAIRCFQEFMRLTEGTDDDFARALPYSVLGRVYIFVGRFNQARDYLKRAKDLMHQRKGTEDDLSYVQGMYGSVFAYLGDFSRCRQNIQESISIAKTINHQLRICQGQVYLGITCAVQGEWEEAKGILSQGIDVARQINNVIGAGTGSSFLGLCYLASGDITRAVELCQFARAHIASSGGTWTFSMVGSHLTECLLASGDVDGALRTAKETLLVIEAGEHWGETSLYLGLGRVYARMGRQQDARHFFDKAILVSKQQESPVFEAKARLGLGAFLLSTGTKDAGLVEIEWASETFQRCQMPWYLARANALASGLSELGPCP